MTRSTLVASLITLAACGGGGGGDAGTGSGGTVASCHAIAAGCTSFIDLTGGDATIAFGGAQGFAYSPKCAMVRVGQPVEFLGDFSLHPISETCGPVDAIPHNTSGTTLTVTFTTSGLYGYRCDNHFADGMVGGIQVTP